MSLLISTLLERRIHTLFQMQSAALFDPRHSKEMQDHLSELAGDVVGAVKEAILTDALVLDSDDAVAAVRSQCFQSN